MLRRGRRFSANMGLDESDMTVDLTPMLDVVFIMLIFFIVTATFVKDAGIDIHKPEAQSAVAQEEVDRVIVIDAEERIWFDQQVVELAGLPAHLRQHHAMSSEKGLLIQADERASVKVLAAVLDAARTVVSPDNISLATEVK